MEMIVDLNDLVGTNWRFTTTASTRLSCFLFSDDFFLTFSVFFGRFDAQHLFVNRAFQRCDLMVDVYCLIALFII